jgi:riboflavin biosynthesis pyrimidine reductase
LTASDWDKRFRNFVARKEEDARKATLSPFVTAEDRGGRDFVWIGDSWTKTLFDGPFYASQAPGTLPAVNLVFVQSRDGNTGAADPSTLGAGDTDKHLIYEGLSRVAVDAVLAGADTIRGGDVLFSVWREELVRLRTALGKPRHPAQIVATLRGLKFDDTLLYNIPSISVVLLTVPDCADLMDAALSERPWITPVVMKNKNDLRSAFEALRRLGIERVSVVGGRTVATSLIDAGLVQDIYLTTSPREGGQPNTPMYPKPLNAEVIVRKHGTGDEAGVVFEHLLTRL